MISNFNITGNDLYDLFGKYGPIRQIRIGTDGSNLKTKGTAYIVYESPDDAKEAMGKLNGFHLMERYIVGESSCAARLGSFGWLSGKKGTMVDRWMGSCLGQIWSGAASYALPFAYAACMEVSRISLPQISPRTMLSLRCIPPVT